MEKLRGRQARLGPLLLHKNLPTGNSRSTSQAAQQRGHEERGRLAVDTVSPSLLSGMPVKNETPRGCWLSNGRATRRDIGGLTRSDFGI